MRYDNLSICIPAFNEGLSIRKTLEELREKFSDAEIIVVDDGSQDNTAKEVASVDGIKFLSHKYNKGYGASLKNAMRNSTGKYILWFDGDGQHRVEDIERLIRPVLDGEMDSTIGVRKGQYNASMKRIPGKLFLKYVAELLAREKLPDFNSGFRCFQAKIIKKYLHLLPDGFSASTTTTLLMIKRGYKTGYVDVISKSRLGSSSVKIFRDGFRTFHTIIRVIVLFEAFGFFSILSMLQIIPGLVYGVYLATMNASGFPVLAATMVISGVLTFFMGLLGDQISAIRKERFEDDIN